MKRSPSYSNAEMENTTDQIRAQWKKMSAEVRDHRNTLGDNRIQFHMCTLVIDCLRYSDPKDVRESSEVLERAWKLIQNKKADRHDYAELSVLLQKAGFEDLPEIDVSEIEE